MNIGETLKFYRNSKQLPQRKIAEALGIDTATYCKIEKSERRASKEQISVLEEIFDCEKNELLRIWLADRIYDVVKDEKEANEALKIVQENIAYYGR